jgi:hypothetical protein
MPSQSEKLLDGIAAKRIFEIADNLKEIYRARYPMGAVPEQILLRAVIAYLNEQATAKAEALAAVEKLEGYLGLPPFYDGCIPTIKKALT